jgi:hypothetical protein
MFVTARRSLTTSRGAAPTLVLDPEESVPARHDLQETGLRALAAAVLAQAVRDAFSSAVENLPYREEAREFLSGKDGDLAFWCKAADIDPAHVTRTYEHALREPWHAHTIKDIANTYHSKRTRSYQCPHLSSFSSVA